MILVNNEQGCDFVRKMTPGIRLESIDLNSGNRVLVVSDLSPSGSSREANMADDINKTL